jgi:sugar phosphate isomerase/epimerase
MIISHFYDWHNLPDSIVEDLMAEFSWNGAKYLTINGHQLDQHIDDAAEYLKVFAGHMKAQGLETRDAHAPAGNLWDLNIDDVDQRKKIVAVHSMYLEMLAQLGVHTYTMHVGTRDYMPPFCCELPPLRELAADMLEKLLPVAEKNQVILAVENSFEATNAPDEVIALVSRFKSPWLRCCFDTGHALRMADFEKRKLNLYRPGYIEESWHGHIILEKDAYAKMKPFTVTAHLHDNNGYSDEHKLAFAGRTDWQKVLSELRDTPSLFSIQNEMAHSKHHIPIRQACEIFAQIENFLNTGKFE